MIASAKNHHRRGGGRGRFHGPGAIDSLARDKRGMYRKVSSGKRRGLQDARRGVSEAEDQSSAGNGEFRVRRRCPACSGESCVCYLRLNRDFLANGSVTVSKPLLRRCSRSDCNGGGFFTDLALHLFSSLAWTSSSLDSSLPFYCRVMGVLLSSGGRGG